MTDTPGAATSHPLHAGERIWRESNCYVDLWIGLLHELRLEPRAMLACAAAPQFEGDQWTFCKPTASELAHLYGVRVEELTIWRGLRDQVAHQLARGRVVLLEVDGYFLPDTQGVTYRLAHRKTTIGIYEMDASETLSYFHNAGRFVLNGEDLEGVFASGIGPAELSPFAELVDVSRRTLLDATALRARSAEVAARRLAIGATTNPFREWAAAADAEMDRLAAGDLARFHAWAFAGVRQAGSMAELLGAWCDWLCGDASLRDASTALRDLAQTLAAQQFRLARVPSGGRRPDFADALRRCAALWDGAQGGIARSIEQVMHAESARGQQTLPTGSPIVGATDRSSTVAGDTMR